MHSLINLKGIKLDDLKTKVKGDDVTFRGLEFDQKCLKILFTEYIADLKKDFQGESVLKMQKTVDEMYKVRNIWVHSEKSYTLKYINLITD